MKPARVEIFKTKFRQGKDFIFGSRKISFIKKVEENKKVEWKNLIYVIEGRYGFRDENGQESK